MIRSPFALVLSAVLGQAVSMFASSALAHGEDAARVEGPYVVFVDPGTNDAYLPAAKRLAAFHSGEVVRFDPAKLADVASAAREKAPRFVVFVLPPAKIDVDLAHDILELAVRVDDDPFVDFEFGFVTGRDGAAASAFVETIIAAWGREPGRRAGLFGSWEGTMLPPKTSLSALSAMGFEGRSAYVLARDSEEERLRETRAALTKLAEDDALLFMSHGYPDEMASCFRAADLRIWDLEWKASVLVNCACYNGAPGRWFAPGPSGPVDRGVVDAADSVALEILDSGIPAYVGGIDPWHGPLALQVFDLIAGEGMRVGEATKRMFDRLALEYWPEPIDFPKTLEHRLRFSGEGENNRRHNGGGMILYGDPAYAPFANIERRAFATVSEPREDGSFVLRMGTEPLVEGVPGDDFSIPMNVLLDYYSVDSAENLMQQLRMELYRVVTLPEAGTEAPELTVRAARLGTDAPREAKQGADSAEAGSTSASSIEALAPQVVLESHAGESRLHVRVPLGPKWFPPGGWPLRIAREGMIVEIDAAPARR